mgnify:CR=1 FL=1
MVFNTWSLFALNIGCFKLLFRTIRNKLIIELLYSTGIRKSELINIKECDVDFANKTVKVLGKRNKERIIPLTQELITSLEKFLEINRIKNPEYAGMLKCGDFYRFMATGIK